MDIKYSFVSSRTPWKKGLTEQSPSKDGGFDFRLKPTKDTKGIIDLTHLEDGGFNHLEDYKLEGTPPLRAKGVFPRLYDKLQAVKKISTAIDTMRFINM